MKVDEFKDSTQLKTAVTGSLLLLRALQNATNRRQLRQSRLALRRFHRLHFKFPDSRRRA